MDTCKQAKTFFHVELYYYQWIFFSTETIIVSYLINQFVYLANTN